MQQYESAKAAYRRVLDRDPKHAKVLQQLGWLHHQQSNSYTSQDQAIEYLEQSVSSGKVVNEPNVKLCVTDLPFRQSGRPKLVPTWTLLYGPAKVPQSL
jgi:tetratricopeptide (TPR) repeat protein